MQGGRMSRGPGQPQRAVVDELRSADGYSLSRRELEEIFVRGGEHGSSNLLRALRGLQRVRLVRLREGPDLDRSRVSLLLPAEPLDEDAIFRVLAEIGNVNAGAKR